MLAPMLALGLALLFSTPGSCFAQPVNGEPPDTVYLIEGVDVEESGWLSDREIRATLGFDRGPTDPDRLRLSLERLGKRLIDEGFLEARLELLITTGSDPADRGVRGGKARIWVQEGQTAVWDTVRVQVRGLPKAGPKTETGAETGAAVGSGRRPDLRSPEGEFSPDRFEEAIWGWIDAWTENGFPFAVASVESLVVRDGKVRAGIRCETGPRMTVESVTFPGLRTTRQDFLERWIRFGGDPLYRDSEWKARRRRLEQSGLFLVVGEPRLEPISPTGLRVSIPVEEGPHNRFEGAVGYAGKTETLSGFASVELGNLFGTGRKLGLRWERLQDEQTRFHLEYHEPLLWKLPIGVRLLLEQQVQDSTYTLDRMEGSFESLIGWDFYVSLGGEYRRAVLGPEPSELTKRFSTVFGARWEGLRPGLWRGGRVAGSFRTGRSEIRPRDDGPLRRERLDRVEFEAERYWPLGRSLLLRGRVLAAGLSGGKSDSLSAPEALWIGGSASVRGYREEAFATRRYGVTQVEFGAPVPASQGRAYLFVDGVWFRTLAVPGEGKRRVGYGVGLTSETASRSFSLDFGVPGGSPVREGRVHLRIQTRF